MLTMKKLLDVKYINNVRLSAFYLSTETALGVYLVEFPAVIAWCDCSKSYRCRCRSKGRRYSVVSLYDIRMGLPDCKTIRCLPVFPAS